MHILQTIAGFGAKSGGTSTCTYDLLSTLQGIGCDVDLLTVQSTASDNHLMGVGERWIQAISNDYVTPYGYSRNLKQWLQNRTKDYDLLHTNGLWMYCNHITCSMARRFGKPYIITPHGMLYPNALRRSYWKKYPLLKLCFEKDIHQASCMHATCNQEMEHIRTFGYKGPIAVIANPVDSPDYITSIRRGDRSRTKFGFLGRMHPRKKIENLLYGAAELTNRQDEFDVVIIGKGDEKYEQFLRSEVARIGLKNVQFLGFVTGREKYERLAEFSVLFVPSDFENFGMIVPEALSVGTPVMASLGTPWEELNTHQCGWWVERSPESIATIMHEVLDMDIHQLAEMGERGKLLVKEKYPAEEVGKKMKQLYEWVLYGGVKPGFVYL